MKQILCVRSFNVRTRFSPGDFKGYHRIVKIVNDTCLPISSGRTGLSTHICLDHKSREANINVKSAVHVEEVICPLDLEGTCKETYWLWEATAERIRNVLLSSLQIATDFGNIGKCVLRQQPTFLIVLHRFNTVKLLIAPIEFDVTNETIILKFYEACTINYVQGETPGIEWVSYNPVEDWKTQMKKELVGLLNNNE